MSPTIKRIKSCIILVRVLDPSVGDIRTRFLDMPIVNIGTAQHLFAALKLSLTNKGLDFSKCISFMSDTTNIMKGARSGVQKLIRNECPEVLDVGCICHLADLTVKAGLGALPVDIDKLFIDVFYYFYHSSKRKQEFCDLWCSLFTSEPQTILKHCTTRWLSLLRCVGRYLTQFEGLKSYFLSCGEAETAKVQRIIQRLENPLTKPLLLFLSFILPSMDKFNKLFQKSTQNTTCQLYTEMNRLVKLYASNLLKADTILAAGENLSLLSFATTGQLPDENLGLGGDTWIYINGQEEEQDFKPFYGAVRSFYVAILQKKLIKKFPFQDTILKDLGIINPLQVRSYSINTVISLAKRFKQLQLDNSDSLDSLRDEFMDFILSPIDSDLPDLSLDKYYYTSATNEKKPRAGMFWNDVSKIKTLDGSVRFPCLSRLMAGLLSIPVSNADSERGFSILRKIHTDQRPSLKPSTIASIMSIKFNCEECCHDSTFSPELLTKCKKATCCHSTASEPPTLIPLLHKAFSNISGCGQ